ncbi:MAG: serine/threonine protein kinase [Gammaproteobacteria bacterium]|jgi:serine/threonine protein kinase
MSSLPRKIGKYEIIDVAGRGAMGIVYLAHDPFINRQVAIKVCSTGDDFPDDDQDVAAVRAKRIFFNEAQSAGTLDNANILRVYDAGEADDGQPYIVMEYIKGGETLKTYCVQDNLLPIPKVVSMIHKCAKALDYAHRRGVLHRDIKPANIMLNEELEPKIGDFGIAQQLHVESTQLMTAVGSPRYMSPEQATDEKLNGQTDLYSLGVSLYELLTGRPPYDANALAALMLAITTKEPNPIRKVRPEIPEELAQIVHKAIAKDLSVRYQTGAQMAEELARLLDDISRPVVKEVSEEDQFARARDLSFFNDFSDEELEEVMDVGIWQDFPAGTPLMLEGARDQSFFIIASGDVAITVQDKEVCVVEKGECVGELGFLAPVERTATVMARSDVGAIKVDAALMEWASIPVQMRFNKTFQQTLIDRLAQTTRDLASRMP